MKNMYISIICFFATLFSADAATVARFVDYVEFNPYNDGSINTYIDTGLYYVKDNSSMYDLDPRYMNCYYDITLNEDQRDGTSIICGRDIANARTKSVGVSLVKSSGKYHLNFSMWLSSKSATSTLRMYPVELGKRYRFSISKFGLSDRSSTAAQMHAKVEDVENKTINVLCGNSFKSTSGDYGHQPFGILGMVQGKEANIVDKYGTRLNFHHARIWYNSSKKMTFDLYPCIDTDGNAALYDRISGKLFYTKTMPDGVWYTSSSKRKTEKGRLVANENTPDSKVARVTAEGTYEFLVEANAGNGMEFSADGGTTWVEEYKTWVKQDSENVVLVGRRKDPNCGFQSLGWQSSSLNPSFYSGEVTGCSAETLTVPFSGAHSFILSSTEEGMPENLLQDGDFEKGSAVWFGETDRVPVTDTSYVLDACPKGTLGEYVWGLGSEKFTVAQDGIKIRPGKYKLSFNYAQQSSGSDTYRGSIKVDFANAATSVSYQSGTMANHYNSVGTVTFPNIEIQEGGEYQLKITLMPGTSGTARKIWIDNVSLTLVEPFSGLKVEGEISGNSCDYKDENGKPSYGSYPLKDGDSITLTVPSGSISVEGGAVETSISGYRIDEWDNENSQWKSGSEQTGHEVTYTQTGDKMARLVWLWGEASLSLKVRSDIPDKKVSLDRSTWQDEIEKSANIGDEITLYAGEDDTLTYLWKGLPANAEIFENGRKVVFTVEGAYDISLIACSSASAVWSGSTGDGVFGNPENWYGGVVPGESDSVEIPKGAEIAVKEQIKVAALSVGMIGEGSTTITFENGTTENVVSGDVVLGKGTVLTHKRNSSQEAYKLVLSVGGDLSIQKGAKIDVSSMGFAAGYGPGKTRTKYDDSGSAYGGDGRFYVEESGNRKFYLISSYGSIKTPFNLGSGGIYDNTSGYGAGAIKLTVGGMLSIEGEILADATTEATSPGGTGGSIWIVAGKIVGSGKLSASSLSAVTYGKSSSGGRIALYQTSVNGWDGFTGTIAVSSVGGSGGTIYKQDSTGFGVVTFAKSYSSSTVDTFGQRFPMADDGNPREAFLNDSIVLEDTKVLITADVKVQDIDLANSNSRMLLDGHCVRVISKTHKNGLGWRGENYENRIESGTIDLGDGEVSGKIVWPEGFFLKIR